MRRASFAHNVHVYASGLAISTVPINLHEQDESQEANRRDVYTEHQQKKTNPRDAVKQERRRAEAEKMLMKKVRPLRWFSLLILARFKLGEQRLSSGMAPLSCLDICQLVSCFMYELTKFHFHGQRKRIDTANIHLNVSHQFFIW